MKPLSEWTLEALWDWILNCADCREHVGELLRRERERCARLADDVAVNRGDEADRLSSANIYRPVNQGGWQAAREIADRIRGLQ